MSSIKRVVSTSFWDDEKVVDSFSPEDKFFMLYLLTNPHTTQLGIYKLVPKQAAFELGYSEETVKVLLDRFEDKYKLIKYSKDTCEVAIKNFLRHSIVSGGKPVMDCLLKEEKQIKDNNLIIYIYNNIKDNTNINNTVKEYIEHIRGEYIDIYNDNERIVNESSTNRQIIKKYMALKDAVIAESISLPDRGKEKCEWCGNMVLNIENHHFPIPKRLGGVETVRICHDCHKKFHDYETKNKNSNKTNGFKPPTVSDVEKYCIENEYIFVYPDDFVNFYASKNWMVGKNKMTSWKSAVAGWNSRARKRDEPKNKNIARKVKEYRESLEYQNLTDAEGWA